MAHKTNLDVYIPVRKGHLSPFSFLKEEFPPLFSDVLPNGLFEHCSLLHFAR